MSATYFWDGEKVITLLELVFREDCEPYLEMHCVDMFANEESLRYGMFSTAHRDCVFSQDWVPIPFDRFPKEFKMHLLLLI